MQNFDRRLSSIPTEPSLNGHTVPEADGSGRAFAPNGADRNAAAADGWSSFYAEGPAQAAAGADDAPAPVAPVHESAAQEAVHVDGSPAPAVPAVIAPADDEISGEALPSAAFRTPAKLAHYTRLAEGPRLDLDFIQAEAQAGGAQGEARVFQHHTHLWNMARGGLRHTFEQKRVSILENLAHLGDDILRTRRMLAKTKQFEDVPGATPVLDWKWHDRAAASLLGLLCVFGVAVDVFTWVTILCQADRLFAHHPALALVFGAVPFAFPFFLERLLEDAGEDKGGRSLSRAAAWFGAAICFATIVCFTLGHDTLSEAAARGFGSLHGGSGAAAGLDWKPLAQKLASVFLMVAAAFFAALCGHTLAGMFKRRRRIGRVANPQYKLTARTLERLQAVSHDERETLGAVTGKLDELASEREALVGAAVNYFRALRAVYVQSEQRLTELLRGPAAPVPSGRAKLRKGAQTLGLALLGALAVSLASCDSGGASSAGAASPASGHMASHVVFGVSPGLNDSEREAIFHAAGELAMQGLPIGGSLEVWDAYGLHRVCAIEMPDDSFYCDNPAARQKLAEPAMQELSAWLTQPAATPEAPASILLPQFVEAIAEQRRSGETAVLVAGSALYVHPRDLAWNLRSRDGQALNAFFTDGHLRAPLELTPFSTRGRESALAHTTVHLAYLRDDMVSEAQRQGLTRFYALWVKSQQGRLATMTRDLGVALDNLRRGTSVPVADPEPRADEEKPELREIRVVRAVESARVDAPVESAQVAAGQADILSPLTEAQRRATPPLTSPVVRELTLGARWSNHVDIDIHVAHHPGVRELFYGCPHTPEGLFHKDWQDAPPGVQGFEKVTFSQPADLRQVSLALNLYRGSAPGGVDVTVRIIADGRHYEKLFHVAASEGNRGANSAGRAHDPHWVVIGSSELAAMCGLR